VLSLIERNELISSDKFLSHTLICPDCVYLKSDFFFRKGEWRGEVQLPLYMRRDFKGKNLIVGHSDISIGRSQRTLARCLGAKTLWGVNTEHRKAFASSLPLGVTNDSGETKLHKLFGDTSHLAAADSTPFRLNFDGSIYANFNVETNRAVRGPLLEQLRLQGANVEMPELSPQGRIQYLRNLRSHSLVPCPEGNGVDTHRLWETLYMGGTPVVISNKIVNSLINGLPVIVLENWKQLKDYRLMQELWMGLNSRSYSFVELGVTHWIKQICLNARMKNEE
jgi:hypothetical protein